MSPQEGHVPVWAWWLLLNHVDGECPVTEEVRWPPQRGRGWGHQIVGWKDCGKKPEQTQNPP